MPSHQPSNDVFTYGKWEEFCSFVESYPSYGGEVVEKYAEYLAHKHALPCKQVVLHVDGSYDVVIPDTETEKYRLPRWAYFVHWLICGGTRATIEDLRYVCLLCHIMFRPGMRNEDMPDSLVGDDFFDQVNEPIAPTLAEEKEYTPEEILAGVMGLPDKKAS